MSRRTDPAKRDAKFALRKMRAEGEMESRRQNKIAFDLMFGEMVADSLENADPELVDAIKKLNESQPAPSIATQQ